MLPNADDPLGRIRDGALAAREGRVVWIGEDRRLEGEVDLDGDLLDAAGASGLPRPGDAHTPPGFAGSPRGEVPARASGAPSPAPESRPGGLRRPRPATRGAPGGTPPP